MYPNVPKFRTMELQLLSLSTNQCYTRTPVRYEKPLKNHPLDVFKKYVETYSSSNTVAQDPEERVQLTNTQFQEIIKVRE